MYIYKTERQLRATHETCLQKAANKIETKQTRNIQSDMTQQTTVVDKHMTHIYSALNLEQFY